MAKNESTAVNALIDQVSTRRPVPPSADEELLFAPPRPNAPRVSATVSGAGEVAPLPQMRAPNSTGRNPIVAANRPSPVRMSTAPATRPHSIPPIHRGELIAASSPLSRLPLVSPPSQPPVYLEPGVTDPWVKPANTSESFEGTVQVPRPRRPVSSLYRLIGPGLCLAVLGIFVGGFFVFDGEGNTSRAARAATPPVAVAAAAAAAPTPTPAEPAAPTPTAATPAPTPEPTPAPIAAPVASDATLVEVRIDSRPSGATVMLVDEGKTSFLGSTPLDASLDPARKYELVFTHGDRPTRVEPLDPKTQKRVAVVLGAALVASTPAVASPPPPTASEKRRASRRAARAARAEVATAEPTRAEPAITGSGTLMISSKPPCQIYVDGKATGLTTPQRAITLPAGAHKITLVNSEAKIRKTFAVQISADKATKVIKDLMTE